MRSKKCLHDIFIQAHKNIIDKHLDLCEEITLAMMSKKEADVKDKFLLLKEKCRIELEDFGVTPEEHEYIKQHDKEWFSDVIPYVVDKLMDKELEEGLKGE